MRRIHAACLAMLLVLGTLFTVCPAFAEPALEAVDDDALEAVLGEEEESPVLEAADDSENLASPYGITLLGVPVTSENADDILGDGTASYDEVGATLTLENCAATGNEAGGPMLSCVGNMTLSLEGENALLGGTDPVGIFVSGNLDVEGNGSLVTTGGYVSDGGDSRGIQVEGSLTFDADFTGTVVATGGTSKGTFRASSGILVSGDLAILNGTVIATGGDAAYSMGVWVNGTLTQIDGLFVAQGGSATAASIGVRSTTDDASRIFEGGFAVMRAGLLNGGLLDARIAIEGSITLDGAKVAGQVGWPSGEYSTDESLIADSDQWLCTGVVIVPASAEKTTELMPANGKVKLVNDVYHVTTDGSNFGSNVAMGEKPLINLNCYTALFVDLSESTEYNSTHVGYALNANRTYLAGGGRFVAVGGVAAGSSSTSKGLNASGQLIVDGPNVVCVGGPATSVSRGCEAKGTDIVKAGRFVGVGLAATSSYGKSYGISENVSASGAASIIGVGGSAGNDSWGIYGRASSYDSSSILGVGGISLQAEGIYDTATAEGGVVMGLSGYATQYSIGCNSGMISYPGCKVVGLGGVVPANGNSRSYGSWASPYTSHAGDQVVAGRTRAYSIYSDTDTTKFFACADGATGLAYTDYAGTQGETPVDYDTAQGTIFGFKRVVISGSQASESSNVAVAVGTTTGGSATVVSNGSTHNVPAGGGLNLTLRAFDMVELTAKAASGYRFVGWYEGVIGPSGYVEDHTDAQASAATGLSIEPEEYTKLRAVFEKIPPRQLCTWRRRYGQVALDTMEAIAGEFGSAKVAIVTTNASFKDALAASAFAGQSGALVLTTPKGLAAAQTKRALKAAGVGTVYVVGSASEVTDKTMAALKSGTGVTKVYRVGGSSPSARAIAVAKKCTKHSNTVIIATQGGFKDALSIAPYSYATKSPILYAEANKKLSAATLKYIKSAGYTRAIIVGGPVALPRSIETQLTGGTKIKSAYITRLAGSDSYATSEVIAKWATGQYKNGQNIGTYKGKPLAYVKFQPTRKLGANRLAVATSQNWKDALCGAALCGKNGSVILLADSKTSKSNYSRAVAFCKAHAKSMSSAYVLGGEAAVSSKVWNALVKSTTV